MSRMIIVISCAAIIAAAGLGLAAGYMSGQFPSTAQPAAQAGQAVAAVPDGDPAPSDGPAASQDVKVADTPAAVKKGTETQYGPWVYSCMEVPAGAPKNCVARLALHDKSRNVTVLNWLVGYNKDKELLMEITTPVDVLIAPGLKMSIADGPAQGFAYLSCAAVGCLTRITPDAQLLADLRKAKTAKLSIETPAGKAITFSIEVSGFADSLDALAQP